jgi:hypothetical protein
MWEGGEGGLRVPTSAPHTINACWFLFLLFAYLLVAEAASFDKKELCRSDTKVYYYNIKINQRKEEMRKQDGPGRRQMLGDGPRLPVHTW